MIRAWRRPTGAQTAMSGSENRFAAPGDRIGRVGGHIAGSGKSRDIEGAKCVERLGCSVSGCCADTRDLRIWISHIR